MASKFLTGCFLLVVTVASCGGSAVRSPTDGGPDASGAAGKGGAGGVGGAGGAAAGGAGGSAGAAGGASGGGAGGVGGASGAGGAGQGSTSYNYQFTEIMGASACDTGQQNFTTLAAMCAALQSDSVNHTCALTAREAFFGLHCTGTFQEMP